MTHREALRHAIDEAKRAQLEERGGYSAVERDARKTDREIVADPFAEAAQRRIAELEAENRKLKAKNLILSSRVVTLRARAEMWKHRCLERHRTRKPERGTWHAEAIRLRGEGWSYPQIARLFNVDHTTVMYACKESRQTRRLRSVA